MLNKIIGRRRPFAEELPAMRKNIFFNEREVEDLKKHYLIREMWYQLAILTVLVLAFFFGQFFNLN